MSRNAGFRSRLTHLSLNVLELDVLHESVHLVGEEFDPLTTETATFVTGNYQLDQAIRKAIDLLPLVEHFWLKCGAQGLIHIRGASMAPTGETSGPIDAEGWSPKTTRMQTDGRDILITHYPALPIADNRIISTTGAGDSLAGGLIAGLLCAESDIVWVRRAMDGARRSLTSRRAVA